MICRFQDQQTQIYFSESQNSEFSLRFFSAYHQIFILTEQKIWDQLKIILFQKYPFLISVPVFFSNTSESEKSLSNAEKIWLWLLEHQANKKSLLLNFGGGMICDLGGFVAATYQRGIDFVNFPTTVLAQVDAAIGGKTSINLGKFKNQIGLFAPAKAVVIDSDFLSTLTKREIFSGFMEIYKMSLIAPTLKKELFLDQNLDDFYFEFLNGDFSHFSLKPFIYKSIFLKTKVVEQDPTDKKERKYLNFGHSFAHALEAVFMDQTHSFLHGEAVGWGMWLEILLAKYLGFSNIHDKILAHLKKILIVNQVFLPYLPLFQDLLIYLKQDKKNENEKIQFIILEDEDRLICHNLSIETLTDFWHQMLPDYFFDLQAFITITSKN